MKANNTTRRRPAAKKAFTLVELLVVIAIIMLLAGILVPTVTSAITSAYLLKSETRIAELNDGCMQYFQDWRNTYPGQAKANTLIPGGSTTGSSLLAEAMFTKRNEKGVVLATRVSQYATYMDGDLLDGSENAKYKNTISDRFPVDKRPILYFPSRLNAHGMNQYQVGDNTYITDTWSGFQTEITDGQYGTNTPYKQGKFILIGSGANRLFVDNTAGSEQDNQHNWK